MVIPLSGLSINAGSLDGIVGVFGAPPTRSGLGGGVEMDGPTSTCPGRPLAEEGSREREGRSDRSEMMEWMEEPWKEFRALAVMEEGGEVAGVEVE
jgi:hypothetical protein